MLWYPREPKNYSLWFSIPLANRRKVITLAPGDPAIRWGVV